MHGAHATPLPPHSQPAGNAGVALELHVAPRGAKRNVCSALSPPLPSVSGSHLPHPVLATFEPSNRHVCSPRPVHQRVQISFFLVCESLVLRGAGSLGRFFLPPCVPTSFSFSVFCFFLHCMPKAVRDVR